MRFGVLIWAAILGSLALACPAASPIAVLASSAWGAVEDAGALEPNANASIFGSTLRLTDEAMSQVGSIFRKAQVDARSFETSFSFVLKSNGDHGDGITLCIQNDPLGPLALGSAGGYLGYGACEAWNSPGIKKSIAIEFDNYCNSEFKDLPEDHIGINTDASVVSRVSVTSPFPLTGSQINVRVTYYEKILTVYMSTGEGSNSVRRGLIRPLKPVLSYHVDIPVTVGADTAYIGFTGATASAFQSSDVIYWTFANPKVVPQIDGPPVIILDT